MEVRESGASSGCAISNRGDSRLIATRQIPSRQIIGHHPLRVAYFMNSILDRTPLEWMRTRVSSSAVDEKTRVLNSTVVRPLLETKIDSDECIESAVIQISR